MTHWRRSARIGCCPGIVAGRARVFAIRAARRSAPGDILVAEHTDPGWIMLFPPRPRLLVERGSLLSHAAIVARELGIPAVVSVPGVTRWLRTATVEMDGRPASCAGWRERRRAA